MRIEKYGKTVRPSGGRKVGGRPGGAVAEGARRGFALVEMMIGSTILATTVVGVYAALTFGFGLIRLSQENLRANQILVQKLETLRLYDWSKTAPGGSFIPKTFPEYFWPNGSVRGTVYTGTIAITAAPLTESYAGTVRQVTVTLTWNSGGVQRQRSMTTLVSQYGIQTFKP